MLVDKDLSREVVSTMQGEKIDLSLDENSLVHLMGVMTNLYSDPELACIREYSTNALDSHREAGIERPIEVTLPSPLNPSLKIKDYGVGLGPQELRDIYSKYGASTKRDTNEQVGMLGLGCKSALTYADQFTIEAVKDGQKTVAAVSRDDSGVGAITVVSCEPTDESSGVEIVIPAKSHHNFESKARDFFSVWGEGDVLVNGAPPSPFDPLLKLDDDLFIVNGHRRNHLVMGNVSYPFDGLDYRLPYGLSVLHYVDIGAVNFTPSREELHMTAKTKQTVASISKRVEKEVAAAIQREVDDATSKQDALKVFGRLAGHWGSQIWHEGFEYNGEEIQDVAEMPTGKSYRKVLRNSYRQKDSAVLRSVSNNWLGGSVWFKNYDVDKEFTATKKKKLLQFCANKQISLDVNTFLLADSKPPSNIWIDASNVFDWTDVEKEKLPRKVSTGYVSLHPTGSYEASVKGGEAERITADKIDTSKPIYYSVGNSHKIYEWGDEFNDGTFVVFFSNRRDKFVRDFPTAKNVEDLLKRKAEKWAATVTDDQLAALAIAHDYAAPGCALDAARLEDPALKNYARLLKIDLTKLEEQRRLYRQHVSLKLPEAPKPLEKYPLYDKYVFQAQPAHVYQYLNAAYAAQQNGDN